MDSPRPSRLVRATAGALFLAVVLACGAAGQPAEPVGDPFRAAAAAARARAGELIGRGAPFSVGEARGVLALALVDVDRFASDGDFRARVLEHLPSVLPADAPAALRDRVLYALESGPGLTFEQSEALEVAWGAAERSTVARRVEAPAEGLVFPDETARPIAATFFSFPSLYFRDVSSPARLLRALRERAPEREIVVLADLPVREPLEEAAGGLGVHWIESYGRPYSPWPRDPFSTAWRAGGGLVLVDRPALQGGREGDAWMARELIQNLPPALDAAWAGDGEPEGVAWTEAPFFFHNGHVLVAGGAVWTSLHGLERRILEVLGLDRVPVGSFATAEGIDRYAGAARRVMREMSAFYGRPVRLVHPLPEAADAPTAERSGLLRTIGGGAGLDLDSLVTFVPAGDGGLIALVGDVDAGRELLAGLGADDLGALRETYGLEPPAAELRRLLDRFQESPGARGLDAFLDLDAAHLAAEGLTVRRLPLLQVPTALLAERERYEHPRFTLGWQNVVLAPPVQDGALPTAEGFASGVPAGDARAREIYRQAGAELVLLPPLVESVKANGGLRCASNQVRTPSSPR